MSADEVLTTGRTGVDLYRQQVPHDADAMSAEGEVRALSQRCAEEVFRA